MSENITLKGLVMVRKGIDDKEGADIMGIIKGNEKEFHSASKSSREIKS